MDKTLNVPVKEGVADRVAAILAKALPALAAHDIVKTSPDYKKIALSAKEQQFMVLTTVARMTADIYTYAPAKPVIGAALIENPKLTTDQQQNLAKDFLATPMTNVFAVVTLIAAYYYSEKGYSEIAQQTMLKNAHLNRRTIQRAVQVLTASGLWGVLPGYGKFSTRYYPLFHARSKADFLKAVEQARLGINPFTGMSVSTPAAPVEPDEQDIELAARLNDPTPDAEKAALMFPEAPELPAAPEPAPAIVRDAQPAPAVIDTQEVADTGNRVSTEISDETGGYYHDGEFIPYSNDEPYEPPMPEPEPAVYHVVPETVQEPVPVIAASLDTSNVLPFRGVSNNTSGAKQNKSDYIPTWSRPGVPDGVQIGGL